MKHLLAIPALFLAVPSSAAGPTYLSCVFSDGAGQPWPLQVSADEGQGTVTVLFERNGKSRRYRATFGPDTVSFGDQAITYRLSRVSLLLERYTGLLDQTDRTTCKIVEAPVRAF